MSATRQRAGMAAGAAVRPAGIGALATRRPRALNQHGTRAYWQRKRRT